MGGVGKGAAESLEGAPVSDRPTDVAAGALRSPWTYSKRFVLLNNTDEENKLVLRNYSHFHIFTFHHHPVKQSLMINYPKKLYKSPGNIMFSRLLTASHKNARS